MKLPSLLLAFKALLLLVLTLSCTSAPQTTATALGNLEINLPPRYEHWRSSFEHEWQSLQQAQSSAIELWQHVAADKQRSEIVLLSSPLAAQTYYLANGLSGHSSTPRTFISRRLALLVLPADDRVLAELATPPQTILHDFRHEASHLLSCDYPELLAAPTWFQEGWAELWAPLNQKDVDEWPHAHDVYRWFSDLSLDNLSSAPAEVRYSYMAAVVELAMQNSASKQPWLAKADIDLPPRPSFSGLRGRHAYWDAANNHYLLSSMAHSQVDLDLPIVWDGVHQLNIDMRVGTTSAPLAGLVFYNLGADVASSTVVRIPIDVDNGINAYVDSAQRPRVRPLYPPAERQGFGSFRRLQLTVENGTLIVNSGGFKRIIELSENALQLPFTVRMYVRNGSLEIKHETILN
ncbi:MAG: hypothetical protein ACI84O_000004 [Myxococcota bacterium]|jgi:hypothetical protein